MLDYIYFEPSLLSVFLSMIISNIIFIKNVNYKLTTFEFIYAIVFIPLVEELIFRELLPVYIKIYNYSTVENQVIISLFFSFIHLSNYTVNRNIQVIVAQMINVYFLSLYCLQLNNFTLSLLIHMMYNFISISYFYYINTEKEVKYVFIRRKTTDDMLINDKYFKEVEVHNDYKYMWNYNFFEQYVNFMF